MTIRSKCLAYPGYAFLGTGELFSITVLRTLLEHGLTPKYLVLPYYSAQPEKNSAGLVIACVQSKTDLTDIANSLNIQIIYAPRENQLDLIQILSGDSIECALVACWPYRLDKKLIQCLGGKILNLHPSLLPNYKGPDPVTDQLHKKENNLGVTLHVVDENFDSGTIIKQSSFQLEQLDKPDKKRVEIEAAKLGAGLFSSFLSENLDKNSQPSEIDIKSFR